MIRLRRERISEQQYSPLDAGWDAYIEGRRSSDNPYAINNWKHYDWQQGWELAAASAPSDPEPDPGAEPEEPASPC